MSHAGPLIAANMVFAAVLARNKLSSSSRNRPRNESKENDGNKFKQGSKTQPLAQTESAPEKRKKMVKAQVNLISKQKLPSTMSVELNPVPSGKNTNKTFQGGSNGSKRIERKSRINSSPKDTSRRRLTSANAPSIETKRRRSHHAKKKSDT
jgi:hypothetical protein